MWFVLAAACTVDPLSAAGLAPVIVAAPPAAEVEVPSAPPAAGEDIADGGEVAAATRASGGAAAPAAPDPVKFDPISVPQGPRETSVKWKGVSRRGEPRAVNLGNNEFSDPGLMD